MNKEIKNSNFKKSIVKILIIAGILIIISTAYVYAAPPTEIPADTSSLDKIVDWLALWSGKIGLVVAFFGGIQLALSIKNDDSDAKVRGIKTLVSGLMVFSITKALDLFGL